MQTGYVSNAVWGSHCLSSLHEDKEETIFTGMLCLFVAANKCTVKKHVMSAHYYKQTSS